MLSHKDLEDYILSLPDSRLDYPFGEDVAVYKTGDPISNPADATGQGKMFAIIAEDTEPLRISLKCDPQLAETLRAKYETVLPGYHLNKKHWNTILLTGQLGDDEIKGFIRHSYELVIAQPS